jgi:hypothetical protein
MSNVMDTHLVISAMMSVQGWLLEVWDLKKKVLVNQWQLL